MANTRIMVHDVTEFKIKDLRLVKEGTHSRTIIITQRDGSTVEVVMFRRVETTEEMNHG